MIGIITAGAAIIGGLVYWRLTRNDPLIVADGEKSETWEAEMSEETDIDLEPKRISELLDSIQGLFAKGLSAEKRLFIQDKCGRMDVDDEFDAQFQIPWKETVRDA